MTQWTLGYVYGIITGGAIGFVITALTLLLIIGKIKADLKRLADEVDDDMSEFEDNEHDY